MCSADQAHHQYGGGTSSLRTEVCSMEEGVQYDLSHHQYGGGTSSVQMWVCSTEEAHHQEGCRCVVGKKHTISTDADVQCRSGTPLVRWRHIIITDGGVQYGGECAVWICHTISTEEAHLQYRCGFAVHHQ